MRRTYAAVAAALAVVGSGIAAASAAHGDSGGSAEVPPLNAAKQRVTDQERKLDRANASLAADLAARNQVAKQKAAGDKEARAQLAQQPKRASSWPVGIFDDPEAPAPTSVFRGINRWVGEADGAYLAVHAGASGEDSVNGRIIALWSDDTHTGYTLDLDDTGALQIQSADGNTLTIKDSHGALHTLDAVAGGWVG